MIAPSHAIIPVAVDRGVAGKDTVRSASSSDSGVWLCWRPGMLADAEIQANRADLAQDNAHRDNREQPPRRMGG
jgi:hypothetical protein